MSWLALYLSCVACAVVLLGASLVFGGDDADADADIDADADAPGHAPGLGMSLPFLSLRFWTFLLLAFGLSGTLLSLLGIPSLTTLVVSLASGVAIGWAVFRFFRWLLREEVTGAVGLRDYVDQEARVLLPVRVGGRGKIAVDSLAGRVELVAFTRDEVDIEVGAPVLIVAVDGEGRAEVTTLRTTHDARARQAERRPRAREYEG